MLLIKFHVIKLFYLIGRFIKFAYIWGFFPCTGSYCFVFFFLFITKPTTVQNRFVFIFSIKALLLHGTFMIINSFFQKYTHNKTVKR